MNLYKETNLPSAPGLKYELNATLTHKAEFALFRARQKFFEEEDKAGRMLATYIKEEEALRSIPALQELRETCCYRPGGDKRCIQGFLHQALFIRVPS